MANNPNTTPGGRNDSSAKNSGREIEAPDTHRTDTTDASMGGKSQAGSKDQTRTTSQAPQSGGQNKPGSMSTQSTQGAGQSSKPAPGRQTDDEETADDSENPAGAGRNASLGDNDKSQNASRDKSQDKSQAGSGIAGAANKGADKAADQKQQPGKTGR